MTTPSKETSASGLLQGLRLKTLERFARAPAAAALSPTRPALDGHFSVDGSSDADVRLAGLVQQFIEQDELLRQLEAQATQMLVQIQQTCAAMTRVVELFTQTLRSNDECFGDGIEYLRAMQTINKSKAELLEQSLRFTVLDPLVTRLDKNSKIKQKLAQTQRLRADVTDLRAGTLAPRFVRTNDKDDRKYKLEALQTQLGELTQELLTGLDDALSTTAMQNNNDLFNSMRLQLASFFFHAHNALLSGLSPEATEVVLAATMAVKNPDEAKIDLPEAPTDTDDEDGHDDDDDGDDEDDDNDVSLWTLEDFQRGRPIHGTGVTDDRESDTAAHPVITPLRIPEPVPLEDTESLLALVSSPLNGAIVSHSPTKPAVGSKPAKQRRRYRAGMFLSFRQSFQDRFRASAKLRDPATAGSDDIADDMSRRRKARLESLVAQEWKGVEASLWELDCRGHGYRLEDHTPHNTNKATTLGELLKDAVFLAEFTQFLALEDIARLAKVNQATHMQLRACPPIWKRAIRTGVSPASRGAVWLSILYGPAPWRSDRVPPHHLSTEKRREIYERLLLQLAAKLADDAFAQPHLNEEQEQLVSWLQEIDVDVARTCTKDIYAKNATDDANPVETTQVDDTEVVNTAPVPATQACRSVRSRADTEACIRRVLRAYVAYNPRVGYCQGMNFLVRLLTEVVASEADVFWLFVGLSEPENDRNLYEPGLAVLQPLFDEFEAILSHVMPELHAHLEEQGVPVAAFSARWFLTCFSSFETFGPLLVTRLLDVFVIDGWRIIFSMALVVLDELRDQLLEAELEQLLRILQCPRDYLVEPDSETRTQLVRHALAFSITRLLNVRDHERLRFEFPERLSIV